MSDSPRPLLVFDGDCAFCRRWVGRWRWITGDRVEYATAQLVAASLPEMTPERCARAVQFRDSGGRWSEGAEAAFRALATTPGWGWLWWLYARVPAIARASEALYRWVARHRGLLHRFTP